MWDITGMPDLPTLYSFVETPIFTRRITELASSETLEAIQSELLEDPERWPIVRGMRGARKGRVADPKSPRGKSGSYRYIYLYLPHAGRIHLLFLFGKNEQSDLSPAQTKTFGQIIARIKEEASHGQEK
ncbi:MAG: type II toxin-antitoxin system RelE/ParE family toxin [Acidobacteriota bacterium]|nr:type II toxin-antitoxin system RelE/ParE family toxin [Acidobacteriota bacterium]